MSQHDLNVANQGFSAFRTDLNTALVALGSSNSGTSAPSSPQPKIYDGAAWINLPFYINTSTNDANLTTTEVTSLVPAETDPQATALAIALG